MKVSIGNLEVLVLKYSTYFLRMRKYISLAFREELKKESRRLKRELLESRKQKDEKQKETNDSGKTDYFMCGPSCLF